MKYKKLGRTDLSVSEICLGTMTWGTQNSETEAHEQMDYAFENGINFFDTAELYPTTPVSPATYGRTEEYIGTWLKKNAAKRKDLILATKIAGSGRPHIREGRDIESATIRQAVDASLKRLQTDYLDLYQIHWPNRGTFHFRNSWTFDVSKQDRDKAAAEIAEILETLGELVKEGKLRAVGLSNESAWGAMKYLRLSEKKGLPRIASLQNEYNLLYRHFDLDLAEVAHHEDVGLMAYSPLAAGLLTGKYQNGARPEGSRATINKDLGGRLTPYQEPAVKAYIEVAEKHGLDLAQMALAFCLSRPFMAAAIIGATSMAQLKHDMAAADVTLSDEVFADIARVHRQYPMPL
ncbi:aldo/keto reductase [Neorhizobium galegae]|uniref:aldo/keto reductase n=1 Tax=Neorhizobium galegae TaxID=399 RepID=UPI0021015E64|nr:aldo/keto reductase [Neorhizobium galegae]MCQ1573059.1 aldo/keto reductase [Neorhizobium galegae]MCQ1833686.1 aldo/keto reductase [Neorhizobium galegae]